MGVENVGAQQAAYPSKPIVFVIPNAAATSSDIFGRSSEQMAKILHQPWIVEDVSAPAEHWAFRSSEPSSGWIQSLARNRFNERLELQSV